MKRLLHRIFEVLDGTPAVYGKRQRGQSLLEMAFLTPLLFMLFAGIVEIGWLANNYLNLLETARVGARAGTVQEGDFTPESWEYRTVPQGWPGQYYWELSTVYDANPNTTYTNGDPIAEIDYQRAREFACAEPENLGFYNFIACLMSNSVRPLELREDNDVDDMVISVFALQAIDPRPEQDDFNTSDSIPPLPGDDVVLGAFLSDGVTPRPAGRHMVVVGRYPASANECTVAPGGGTVSLERDPFDYIVDNTINSRTLSVDGVDIEVPLELVRNPNDAPGSWVGFMDSGPEQQRGFVWFGNHLVSNASVECYGSEWDIARIEKLFNLEALGLTTGAPDVDGDGIPDDRAQRANLPNQGVVLVEIFWQHELVLKIPFFSPIFDILGDRTIISVWAAFPVPSIEPNIRYR